MKTIRCLLVDDEELALDILEMYLTKFQGFEIVGRCICAQEVDIILQSQKIDLIFLDIQMPGINGMAWIKTKNSPTLPKIIFCTAFDSFAVESYEVNTIDYLLKPISFDRFKKAIKKVQYTFQKELISTNKEEQYISIRSERKFHKIAIKDILYFHSLSNYYIVITQSSKYIVYGSLSKLEHRLPQNSFIRIHRSYLVAKSRIEALSSTEVIISGKNLPIGKKYRENLNPIKLQIQ
jgi:DNA-binding LytR/AlgR family response regulator